MERGSFRPDVEGLRAVAILLVVGYHARLPGLTGGYIGVDVFFVLSGFLITGLLVRELDTTGRINLWAFYARRARRLLPAAAVVLLTTLAVGYWLQPPVEQLRYTGTAIATALYISNFWFAKEATDYLAADSQLNPFLHTWSLSVEEQFYLVWPCLLLLAAALGARHRLRRIQQVMGVVLLVSLALAVWQTGVQQPLAFFGSHTRAWEFAVGGLVAFLQLRGPWLTVVPWVGLAALGVAATSFNDTTPYPGMAATLPVFGTAAMLLASRSSRITAALSVAPLQRIGRLSYSWYLWHWPVLIFGEAAFGPTTLPIRLALVAVALVLSVVTFIVVEDPIRRAPLLVRSPSISLAATLTLSAAVLFTCWSAREVSRQLAGSDAHRHFSEAESDIPDLYASGCHLQRAEVEPSECAYGDTTATRTVVLFGDSHAAQWLPPLQRLGAAHHLKIVSMTKSACPAVAIQPFDTTLNRSYTECTEWRNAALTRIKALAPVLVVMSSATNASVFSESALQEWTQGLGETIALLDSARIPVLLIRDTPFPGFEVPSCLARAAWNPSVFRPNCDFPRPGEISDVAYAAEAALIAKATRGATLDINQLLCGDDAAQCHPMSNGMVAYRDSHHLTTAFAATLSPRIEAKLQGLGVF